MPATIDDLLAQAAKGARNAAQAQQAAKDTAAQIAAQRAAAGRTGAVQPSGGQG